MLIWRLAKPYKFATIDMLIWIFPTAAIEEKTIYGAGAVEVRSSECLLLTRDKTLCEPCERYVINLKARANATINRDGLSEMSTRSALSDKIQTSVQVR